MTIRRYLLNNCSSTLASWHTAGDNQLVVLDGTKFGNPTSTKWIGVTARLNRNPMAIFKVTGRAGNTLTVDSAIEGTTDCDLPSGCRIENYLTAGTHEEIWTAIDGSGGGVVDLTTNQTIGGNKTFTNAIVGTITGSIAQTQVTGLDSAFNSKANATTVNSHIGNQSNPHVVTASQVGSYTTSQVDTLLSGISLTPGPQGYQGYQGVGGSAGSQGPQGNQGLTGAGTQGVAGSAGPQGYQGNQGIAGVGTQGYQGYQGIAGSAGPQGNQGNQGNTGVGTQGNQGVAGSAGSQGNQGATGPNSVSTSTTTAITGAIAGSGTVIRQALASDIPDISATYATLGTTQTITGAKTVQATTCNFKSAASAGSYAQYTNYDQVSYINGTGTTLARVRYTRGAGTSGDYDTVFFDAGNFRAIAFGGQAPIYQLWKDATPSAAVTFGMSVPGSGVTSDLYFASYASGGGWQQLWHCDNCATTNGVHLSIPIYTSGRKGLVVNSATNQSVNLAEFVGTAKTFSVEPAGHPVIPTFAGAPTTAPVDGSLALDTTNNRLYVRSGSAWKYSALT
jgi:hypothetical protein